MSLLEKQTLDALAILGDYKVFPDILRNRFDRQLALVCHFIALKKVAKSEHDLQTPEIQALVQQYKDNLRIVLATIVSTSNKAKAIIATNTSERNELKHLRW